MLCTKTSTIDLTEQESAIVNGFCVSHEMFPGYFFSDNKRRYLTKLER